LESRLWADDYTDILGSPIWDTPNVRVVDCSVGRDNADVPTSLVPSHAFIWAGNEEETRCLRRIAAYERQTDVDTNSAGETTNRTGFGGFRADYVADSNIPTRFAGMATELDGGDWKAENIVSFDIDGLGGEAITEVKVSRGEPSLKVGDCPTTSCSHASP
jgi:hypothetical protein